MADSNNRTRILFFIGSLRSGGKERRLIELLSYLKNIGSYDLMVVVTKDTVHYPAFHKLDVPYKVLKKEKSKLYLDVLYGFYQLCKEFKPDVIHTWGRIQSLYTLPTVIGLKIPLINSQITDAPPKLQQLSINRLIDKANFWCSKVILSNSYAGIRAFNPPAEKGKVIYNGINLNRFENLPPIEQVKEKYQISTRYTIVMAASFSANKDYDFFYKVANLCTRTREDITFIGVGACVDEGKFKQLQQLASDNKRIILHGAINDVEALVNACDIGTLFSVHGEGISNAVMEYMALSKPVIANNAGGTPEIVQHNENGYLITDRSADKVVDLIIDLLNNKVKYEAFGKASRSIIERYFTLDKMGKAFEDVYHEALASRRTPLPTLHPETELPDFTEVQSINQA